MLFHIAESVTLTKTLMPVNDSFLSTMNNEIVIEILKASMEQELRSSRSQRIRSSNSASDDLKRSNKALC